MQSKKKDFVCWRAIDKLYSGFLYHLHLDPSRNPVTTTCGHRGCYCSWSEKAACVALHQRPCARAWKQWCQPPSVLPLKDSVHMLFHLTKKRKKAADLISAENQNECTQIARRWNRPSMTPKDERCCTWKARKQRASQHAAGLVPYSYFQSVYRHIRHQYREYLNVITARGTLQEILSEKWTNHFFLYFFIPKYAEARPTLRLWCHSRPDVDHIWPSRKTV